ncbi:ferritin-like superfamily [Mortierella sp. GBAus27b]|nr:fts3-like protein [Mortierella sp. GBA43]KAI8345890.1 ferritin-like superfamily [Mortierella sp. GBAus27b]
MSLSKQNFASASEDAVNNQISQELQAAQVYLSLSAWAGNVNQSLPGLEKFFRESAEEERQHAQQLIDYQNRRGGKVVLQTLQAPESNWSSARNAIESTLQLEKDVNKSLLNLHKVADDNNDPQLCDFLENGYLDEQSESVKKIADLVVQLNRVGGDGLGLHLWDQNLLHQKKEGKA